MKEGPLEQALSERIEQARDEDDTDALAALLQVADATEPAGDTVTGLSTATLDAAVKAAMEGVLSQHGLKLTEDQVWPIVWIALTDAAPHIAAAERQRILGAVRAAAGSSVATIVANALKPYTATRRSGLE